MKKKYLYTAIFAAMISLTSCNEDFNADVAAPQTWEQEEIVKTVSSIKITPAENVDLEAAATAEEETVELFGYTIENQIEGSKIKNLTAYISKVDAEEWNKIEVDDEGNANVEELQALMEALFGKKGDAQNLKLKVEASMNADGEAFYLSAENPINITPKKPLVLTQPEYYLVGNIQGWSQTEKTCPLFPLGNNKFTVTADFSNAGNGTPNFKIWADTDFGIWNNAWGTERDGDTSNSGTLKANGGAIQTADNGIYTFTVDFSNKDYTLTKETNQNPAEYTTIGMIGFNGWDADLDMIPSSPHNWYYPGLAIATDSEIKFRADDRWDNSWGGDFNLGNTPFGISTLNNNSPNMKIPAGTYDVLFNDITGRYAFYKHNQ